jgi:hypothetical protein
VIAPSRIALAFTLLSVVPLTCRSGAEPLPVTARVVWVRSERVYVASPEAQALGPGAQLTFLDHGKPIATGEITRVVDSTLAVVTLTSGSLARVKEKDLKRLRILSAPASGPTTLRVGYPSAKRATLFFTCDLLTLVPPFGAGQAETRIEDHLYRVLANPSTRSRGAWPETLEIRLFDEAADEEIALERGEVDVAVFRPGELSTHMRDQPRWQHDLSAPMRSGVVVAVLAAIGADSTAGIRPGDPLLTTLNREMFGGDLNERRFGTGSPARSEARYTVDAACPGREVLERFLSQRQVPPPSAGAPHVRILFVDQPASSPRSVALAAAMSMEGRTTEGTDPADAADIHIHALFAIDCPVVFDARLRPYVSALGAKAFVELFDCTVGTGPR